jgi:hypothetical protein
LKRKWLHALQFYKLSGTWHCPAVCKKRRNTDSAAAAYLHKAFSFIFIFSKIQTMGLLNQKGKDGKKKSTAPKPAGGGSKFIASKSTKAAGGPKKPMTGGSQRGS